MGFAEVIMLVITVLTGTIGQYFLKLGANRLGAVTADNAIALVLKILTIPDLIIGLIFYAGAAVLYILILTRVPLSILGPSAALQYVFAILMGKYLFHDSIPGYRWVGLGLIACGVILVIWKK